MNKAERIKASVDIAAYIGKYTPLVKAGKEWKGRCPFPDHVDADPSLFVNPEKGVFLCHGCGKGGDIFVFIQLINGSTFPEALETARQYAGLNPETGNGNGPAATPGKVSRPEVAIPENPRLFEASEAARSAYSGFLFSPEGKQAREYLQSRDVTEASIGRFRIGACPPGNFLEKAVPGYEAEFLELGLVKEENKRYDFFRNLVLFPIMDEKGRTVGFAGRQFPNASGPKYINSPGSVLYKKSELLFGLPRANGSVFDEKSCVVVEGYFDAIRLFQAGIENGVAIGSAAISAEQLSALKRAGAEKIVFFFDGDEAGRQGAEKAAKTAESSGVAPFIAKCPEGKKDPDEMTDDEIRNALNTARKADENEPDYSYLIPSFQIRIEADRKPGFEFPEDWNLGEILIPRGVPTAVGAYTGNGKTRFLLNMLYFFLKLEKKVFFFTLEMMAGQVAERLTAIAIRKEYGESCSTPETFVNVREGERKTLEHLEIFDRLLKIKHFLPGEGVEPSASNIILLYNEYNRIFGKPDCVFVDYLQIVRPEPETERSSRREQMIKTVLTFASNMLNTETAWIFASQTSRGAEQANRGKTAGHNTDFQESAIIEQTAGLTLLLSIDADDDELLLLNVSKNRFGPRKMDMKYKLDPVSGAILSAVA